MFAPRVARKSFMFSEIDPHSAVRVRLAAIQLRTLVHLLRLEDMNGTSCSTGSCDR